MKESFLMFIFGLLLIVIVIDIGDLLGKLIMKFWNKYYKKEERY